MRILLTNDDGVLAPGLAALARALAELGQVDVVAPRDHQSGASHAITFAEPLLVEEVSIAGVGQAWGVAGRPADCVKLGLAELAGGRPDLVVSGINAGANRGTDVLYSGTVAAATEAASIGFPAVAVSLARPGDGDFDFTGAAGIAVEVLRRCLDVGLPERRVLNLNVPDLSLGRPVGVQWARQSTLPWIDNYDRREDPRGRPYYWLTEDGERDPETDPGTDLAALAARMVTLTVLSIDRTDQGATEALREAWESR